MIFEKTLGRKLIAAPKKLELMNGDSQESISKATKSTTLVTKARRAVNWLFGSNKPQSVQEPASMGKILNLMRLVNPCLSPLFDF